MKAGYVSKGCKGAPANIENPQIVIDIDYPEKDYLPLPIDFFRKNSQGKTYPLPYLQPARGDVLRGIAQAARAVPKGEDRLPG